MSGTDIFLSYARTDRSVARTFAECLGEEGFNVWWDASLHSGETFDEVIEQKLRAAKAVVVLWSPRSVASRWVRAEATLADRRNKLVPAIIEPCDRPIVFELTHTAELSEWHGDRSDARWRTFVEDLGRLVHRDDGNEAVPAPAPQPTAARSVPEASRAPAAPRQPLRPGNDEVILARETRHERPVRQATAPEPLHAVAVEEDSEQEVHCLEIEQGELQPDLFIIDSSSVSIGRTAPADVVLPHRSISREHCIVGLANDELLVTDLNSTNGTYIDDERVHRATILPVGSVVRLGQISLKHAVCTRAEASRRSDLYGTGGAARGRLAATS
ncbi:MAG TPA: TIR domain-containing protein [Sphingomicrobium sp.]|nr:TIR domain-containing protein [Sphingomicrobium sp.]